MALPPCHVLCQFNVSNNNKLSCSLYQRSGDVGLGVPFNIASVSFLTHIIANLCNLECGDIIISFGDIHLYSDHIDQAKIQIERIPKNLPTLKINKILESLDDIENLKIEDFQIEDYEYHPAIKANMLA